VGLNPGLLWLSTRIRIFLRSKMDLNLRKKIEKGYIWNFALYGADTCTLREVGQKYVESFEMWCWREMEKIRWSEVLCRSRRKEISCIKQEKYKLTGLVTSCVETAF
jgi:hypothetical protein